MKRRRLTAAERGIRTQEEVARLLGISRTSVQKTERRAFKKIRAALKEDFA